MKKRHLVLTLAALGLVGLGSGLGLAGLSGCISVAKNEAITLSGVLTKRGAAMDAYWAVRAQDGVLWQLQVANARVAKQFEELQQGTVQVKGARIANDAVRPTLLVSEIKRLL